MVMEGEGAGQGSKNVDRMRRSKNALDLEYVYKSLE